MLFGCSGATITDGKGFFEEECLQLTFKSNENVTVANVKWYRVPSGRLTAEYLKARDATF